MNILNDIFQSGNYGVAYLDPGMGSLIWQGLIGGVLGSLYVTRNFFKGLFARLKQKNNEKAE